MTVLPARNRGDGRPRCRSRQGVLPGTQRGADAVTLAAAVLVAVALPTAARAADPVFRWDPVSGAATYELLIAEDSKFGRVVVETRVSVAGYRWRDAPDGEFYWRVRAIDTAGRPGLWSEVTRIEAGAPQAPAPPVPATGPVIVQCPPDDHVTLSYTSVPDAAGYMVEIARDATFATLAATETTKQPSITVPVPGTGTFHWRVVSFDATGRRSPPSATRVFEVRLAPPTLQSPPPDTVFHGLPHAGTVQLGWLGCPATSAWRVSVVHHGGEAKHSEVAATTLSFQPKRAGRYRWHVAAESESGETSADSSSSFTIELASPVALAPQPGAVLSDGEPAPDIDLRWEPVSLAERYAAEVARDATFEHVVARCEAVEPRCSVRGLDAGSYYWRVEASDGAGHRGRPSTSAGFTLQRRSETHVLSVDDAPPQAPPERLGLRALAVGGRVGWHSSLLRLSTLTVAVELVGRPTWLPAALEVAVRAGYYGRAATIPAHGAVRYPLEQRAHVMPITAAALYRVPTPLGSGATIYVGGGPTAQITRLTVAGSTAHGLRGGVEAIVGLTYSLGTAEAVVEVAHALLGRNEPLLELPSSGTTILVGYRFSPWCGSSSAP